MLPKQGDTEGNDAASPFSYRHQPFGECSDPFNAFPGMALSGSECPYDYTFPSEMAYYEEEEPIDSLRSSWDGSSTFIASAQPFAAACSLDPATLPNTPGHD